MRFDTSRNIHEDVYAGLRSFLSDAQRAKVEEILREHMSGGGVSKDEIHGSIRRELRQLRDEHVISEFELGRIMQFLEKEE